MSSRRWLPGRDLALDLGTTNTLIHRQGRGVVLDEPSVVAVDAATGDVVTAGRTAKEMLGRTPGSMRAVRPLRGGVVHDPDVTERMLRVFADGVGVSSVFRPRIVVCVPSTVSRSSAAPSRTSPCASAPDRSTSSRSRSSPRSAPACR